jgi:hypothetical protein
VLLSLIYFFLVVYINPIMAVDKVTICLWNLNHHLIFPH